MAKAVRSSRQSVAPVRAKPKATLKQQSSRLVQGKLTFKVPRVKPDPEANETVVSAASRALTDELEARVKSELRAMTGEIIAQSRNDDSELGRLTAEFIERSGRDGGDVLYEIKQEVSAAVIEEIVRVKLEQHSEPEDLVEADIMALDDQLVVARAEDSSDNVLDHPASRGNPKQPNSDDNKATTAAEKKNATQTINRRRSCQRLTKPAAIDSDKPDTTAGSLDARPFACSFCPKTFKRRGHLETHENAHRGVKPFKCHHCSQAFTDRNAQLCHERRHEGIRPYTCECGRSFTQRTDYVKHMHTHTGERTHQCRFCDAKFIGSSNLIVHERSHRGERPHRCSECEAAFTKHGDLTRHQRIHTGERPYACQHCSARFTQPAHCRVHEMAHMDIKPHRCRFCDRSFLRIGDLNRHEKRHPNFTGTLKRRNEIKRIDQPRSDSNAEHIERQEHDNSGEGDANMQSH